MCFMRWCIVTFDFRKGRIADYHCKFFSQQLVIRKILLVEAGSPSQT